MNKKAARKRRVNALAHYETLDSNDERHLKDLTFEEKEIVKLLALIFVKTVVNL